MVARSFHEMPRSEIEVLRGGEIGGIGEIKKRNRDVRFRLAFVRFKMGLNQRPPD